MKKTGYRVVMLLAAVQFFAAADSFAVKLTDYPGTSWETLFTNPVCQEYRYSQPVVSASGTTLTAKPKDVYCTKADAPASAARTEAPQYRLLQWINDAATKEIFFAYLSFSNSTVQQALCEAVQKRNVKITFILDTTSDTALADALTACQPANGDPAYKPVFIKKGHSGGIGYAHNKVFYVNPSDPEKFQMAFGSGNMSSGVVLHHENWHFIKTAAKSYFAQSHLCLMRGMIEHGDSASDYSSFIRQCRSSIAAQPEEDVTAFFVPGDGNAAISSIERMLADPAVKRVFVGAHRFTYGRLVNALTKKMSTSPSTDLRFVGDDDLYWVGTTGEATGDNDASEYQMVQELVQAGGKAKYMQTNHSLHLLHHNKFLVFDRKAVFAGAGNLTGTAFSSNYENFYLIRLPEVIDRFNKQYDHLWNDLATAPEQMPAQNVLP